MVIQYIWILLSMATVSLFIDSCRCYCHCDRQNNQFCFPYIWGRHILSLLDLHMYLDLQEPDKVTNPLSPKVVPPCYSLHLQLHIFKVDFCNFLFLSLSLMMTFDAWLKVLFHWWSKQNCGHQKNLLYVCWKFLQTVNVIFHLQYALYGNLLTGWTCEVLLDAFIFEEILCSCVFMNSCPC